MNRTLFILFLFFGSLHLQAEPKVTRNYAYRYFTTRDGLAQMQVMCAFQDRDGYMWFGTKAGVSRWDGKNFKNYTLENGLPSGDVRAIAEFENTTVVFGAHDLSFIYPNDSITSSKLPTGFVYGCPGNCSYPIDKYRLMIFSLQKQNDCSNSHTNHFIFDIRNRQFLPVKGFDETVLNVENKKIYTHTGIFNFTNNKLKRILMFPETCTELRKSANDDLFALGKQNQDFSFNAKLYSRVKSKFTLLWEENYIDGTTRPTIVLNQYIVLFEGMTNKEYSFPKLPAGFNVGKIVNYVFTDRENNVWLCTENGLYNFFNLQIQEYRFGIAEPDYIWSVSADSENRIWLGSYGAGLWSLDKNENLTEQKTPLNWNKHQKEGFKNQYMNSRSLGNTVYIPWSMGLVKYENGNYAGNSFSGVCLAVLPAEKDEDVLYGGVPVDTEYRGLFKGFGLNSRFYRWEIGMPISLCKDARGIVRVGAFRGQGVFTGDTLLADTIKHPYRGVISMELDGAGRLWKGTERGLYCEFPNGKEIRLAPVNIQNQVSSLLVYKNKYLVVGGFQSIFIIDLRNITDYSNPEIIEVGINDGFTGLESGQNGMCVDKNAYVWLITALNVLKFNPEDIVKSHTDVIPSLRISSISYSEDNTDWKHLYFNADSVFDILSGNKFFKIAYIANSMSAPERLRFRYRLVGLNDSWSEEIKRKEVTYTSLPYGDYVFQIQCSIDGLKWSNVVSSKPFRLLRPWYMSYVAIILYVLIFILSLFSILRWIIRRNQRRKMEEINRSKLENELQLNTLRSKIIPHFTKNVLSAIGYFAMTDKLKAGYYISLFSEFTQNTLTNADKNYIPLHEELDYIKKYLELEKMRFGDKFDFEINVCKTVNVDIYIPTMTLHTYCDNAIRHGLVHKEDKGFIIVTVTTNKEGTCITVFDNGIGRKKAYESGTRGNGQGIGLIQAQLDFYNQINEYKIIQNIIDVENEDGFSGGTKVELYIPTDYRFFYS